MAEQNNNNNNSSGGILRRQQNNDGRRRRMICRLEEDGGGGGSTSNSNVPCNNIVLVQQTTTTNGSSSSRFSLLSQLEQYLVACIDDNDNGNDDGPMQQPPLCYMPRADCAWLACRKPKRLPLESVLGIIEEQDDDDDDNEDDNENDGDDDKAKKVVVDREVYFTAYRPLNSGTAHHVQHPDDDKDDDNVSCSKCNVPHNDWNRVSRLENPSQSDVPSLLNNGSYDNNNNNNNNSNGSPPPPLHVEWVDLRWQHQKADNDYHPESPRHDNVATTSCCFLPTTAASCTLFLRSLLDASHAASPWAAQHDDYDSDDNNRKDVVILVVNRDADDTTESSLQPLLDYRVSDACPSWFLHAVMRAKNHPLTEEELEEWKEQQQRQEGKIQDDQTKATFLIYRRLPPRSRLSVRHPITNRMAMTGCLWETYYVYPTFTEVKANNKNSDNEAEEEQQEATATATELFRQVSPPYVNALVEYPGLFDSLLLPETLAILQQECQQISHWTAWPEQQHYKATSTSASAGENGGGAPWNVFPLLYCFPANQPENKTWIAPTCSVVPHTVQLLKDHLGDTLRTALFSRLDPGAVLEAHTGWQDLANHVLRVHLPLVVPQQQAGLAGLWVDGCVECHAVGRVVCFDDSKTHRAFNYSNQSRIVLILDLAREPTGLPLGTAVGGHSEELDKFIEQMGTNGSS